MNLLLRIILIPIGYLAAIFAAVSVLGAVEWARAYPPVAGAPDLVTMTAFAVITDAVVMSAIIGYTALGPALVAIGIAEILSLRSVFFFVAAGLGIAALLTRFLGVDAYPALPTEPGLIAAAGVAAGLAYWISSGRWSGLRRAEPVTR